MSNKISYGKNVYDKLEINAVNNTLKNSTQMGKSVNTFENKIAKYFSKKYGLMVNSGSSALTLAFSVLNLPKGSRGYYALLKLWNSSFCNSALKFKTYIR